MSGLMANEAHIIRNERTLWKPEAPDLEGRTANADNFEGP